MRKIRTTVSGVLVAVSLGIGGLVLTMAPAEAATVVVTKAEYRKIKKGQSYAKVKRIVGGRGDYLGHCVEGGGLCTSTSRWYWWKSTSGTHVWVGFDHGEMKRKFRA